MTITYGPTLGGDVQGVMERAPAGLIPPVSATFYTANVVLALEYLHDRQIAFRVFNNIVFASPSLVSHS